MAIRIIDKNATRDFSFVSDDGDPKTIIKIGHMSRLDARKFSVEFMQWMKLRATFDVAALKDKFDKEELTKEDAIELAVELTEKLELEEFYAKSFDLFLGLTQAVGAIRAVENVLAADDYIALNESTAIAEMLECLPLNMLQELGTAVIDYNQLSVTEKKRSMTPKSSGNSSESGTPELSQGHPKTN